MATEPYHLRAPTTWRTQNGCQPGEESKWLHTPCRLGVSKAGRNAVVTPMAPDNGLHQESLCPPPPCHPQHSKSTVYPHVPSTAPSRPICRIPPCPSLQISPLHHVPSPLLKIRALPSRPRSPALPTLLSEGRKQKRPTETTLRHVPRSDLARPPKRTRPRCCLLTARHLHLSLLCLFCLMKTWHSPE